MEAEALLAKLEPVRQALQLGVPCFSLMAVLRDALSEAVEADREETRTLAAQWTAEIFGGNEHVG